MPAKDEKEFIHVRLRRKAAKGIRRLIRITRRSIAEEANIAVENHLDMMESRRTGK